MIKPHSTILFQGDSITDTHRNREISAPNIGHALGFGYSYQIAAKLLRERPADGPRFYNRGISGNRVVDLYARWQLDAIHLQPNLISILIGVNDTWHGFKHQNGVEPERYNQVYRMLLEYTRQQLPTTQLVLCEPFVLACGVVEESWIDEMRQRQEMVRTLAQEFDAIFVPFQAKLDQALQSAPADYWLGDGVHPTPAGHRLLAECWVETVLGQPY